MKIKAKENAVHAKGADMKGPRTMPFNEVRAMKNELKDAARC